MTTKKKAEPASESTIQVGGVEARAVNSFMSYEDLKRERDEEIQREEIRKEHWMALTSDQRLIVENMVQKALAVMGEQIGSWLPENVENRDGEVLDIHLRILFPSIGEELLKMQAEHQRVLARVPGLNLDVEQDMGPGGGTGGG